MLDYEDNSPLHSACENEGVDAITFLIEHGADTSLLNKNVQSPLHVCTQLNKVKSLQASSPFLVGGALLEEKQAYPFKSLQISFSFF